MLEGQEENGNKFPFTAGQISGRLEEMHTTLSALTHHWRQRWEAPWTPAQEIDILQSRFQSHLVYVADYTFKTHSRASFITREDVKNQRQRHYWQNTNLCRKISRWTHFSFQIKCCKVKQSIEIFLLYVKLLIWLIPLHWNECFSFH